MYCFFVFFYISFFRWPTEFSETILSHPHKHTPTTKTTLVCKMPCWASLVAYSRFILHSAALHSHPLQCWSKWELNIPHNPPPPASTSPTSCTAGTSALSNQDGCIKTNRTFTPSPFSFLFLFFWWEVDICFSNIWASHKSGPEVSTYW